MKDLRYDVAVIGGGAAGMAAALETAARGFQTVIVEREEELGGILLQCVHDGFGLQEFRREMSGPEYAEAFIEKIRTSEVSVFTRTTVTEIEEIEDGRRLVCYSGRHGVLRIECRALVLAMGCRERNRGNIRIPGDRPAGVYTAGLAQRLVNMEGYIPGREVVIIGSGDIGLIMARRMSWVGCRVHAVIEILPYPSGITRNIVQCLNDFSIPLYLGHVVSRIHGRHRVEGVDVTPIVDGAYDYGRTFRIDCDTLLLSVGLVPENELSKTTGVEINQQTGGPVVDATLMTNQQGVFAAGNVLHVHDLVDFVTEEARRAGAFAAAYLRGERPARQIRVKPGQNVRYVNPARVDPAGQTRMYLRSMIVKNQAEIEIRVDGRPVRRIRKPHVQPSEMLSFVMRPADLDGAAPGAAAAVEPVVEVAIL